jgi:putative tryptophan/tyrosine transport system substrate-binding protein
MNRRQAITAVAGYLLVRQNHARAQSPAARPLIVVLGRAEPLPGTADALLRALREAGLHEGRDFDLVFRSGGGDSARKQAVVKEVVGFGPAVVIPGDTPLAIEVRRASETIPIVAPFLTDRVGFGLASSIARPDKNVTGVMAAASAPSKLIELLLEAVPGIVKIGVLFNPTNPANALGIKSLNEDTARLPISLVSVEVPNPADIEPAFQRLTAATTGAFLVLQDAVFTRERQQIADLAIAARLPSIFGFRLHVEAGGLMSYGTSITERYRIAGEYTAKILKGTKPGDLPIQLQPKLELVVNLRTAKALGLDMPRSVLARADELIE